MATQSRWLTRVQVPLNERVRLDHLAALAVEFDRISQEAGETYPATTFVDWLAGEASSRRLVTGANASRDGE